MKLIYIYIRRKPAISAAEFVHGLTQSWREEEEEVKEIKKMVCDIAQDQGWRKGPWTPEEDELLSGYVKFHGEGRWSSVAKNSGLNRTGKSCRLRWVNYLRPGLKRGHLSPQEEAIVIELHAIWGNKWSTIARYLPGRTDNEIKNFWRTHFKKKEKSVQKQRTKTRTNQILKQLEQEEDQKQQNNVDNLTEKKPASSEQNNEEEKASASKEAVVFTDQIMEDQLLSMMYQEFAVWEDEDVLWDGLWNLDDPADSKVPDSNFLWKGFR